MKTILTCTLVLLTSFIVLNAQIPNSSFENWSGDSPENWWSNGGTNIGYTTVVQSTDAQDGTSAAKLEVATFSGFEVGPILSAGTIEHPGFAVTEKYASLNGYYKFTSVQNDIFSVVVSFSNNTTVIGEGTLEIPTGTESYTPFEITFTYTGSSIPDSCKIYFLIEAQDSESAPHSGSFALVDNLSFNSPTSVNDIPLLYNFTLSQNFPNPFNPETIINYSIPEESFVTLKVYDSLGKEILALVNGNTKAGNYKVNFNSKNLSSGIYFYQLKTDKFTETKKMILLK